jgi:hypothetical protein
MIARTLDIAILEAIQAHADRYTHGVVSMEAVLSALGVVSADFLAQIGDQRQCSERKYALFSRISVTTNSRRLQQFADTPTSQ